MYRVPNECLAVYGKILPARLDRKRKIEEGGLRGGGRREATRIGFFEV